MQDNQERLTGLSSCVSLMTAFCFLPVNEIQLKLSFPGFTFLYQFKLIPDSPLAMGGDFFFLLSNWSL